MIKGIVSFCLMSMLFVCADHGFGQTEDDIATQRSCSHCGMDRKAFGYSRMLIRYADGSKAGVCSLSCAVTEMSANKGKQIAALLVADRNTHELVPAEKAFWTIGGSKRGVMTPRAKWAFATRESAEKFIGAYGGEIVSWEKALAAARKEAES
jgi:nitrous oxide reductase accessory protein NosL